MSSISITSTRPKSSHIIWRRHINKARWISLSLVFLLLILIPFLSLYQAYLAANSYDLLNENEKAIYDTMQVLISPFTDMPETTLDQFKGNTWSGTVLGVELSDPLAVVSSAAATLSWNGAFVITAIIPILLTVFFGRFFCGWICPANFLYELNDNLGSWLQKLGLPIARFRFKLQTKYYMLLFFIAVSFFLGTALVASIYPPAVIGREIYFAIAMGGFGSGALFFLVTLLFDLFVARRGFCRYLCPGGALYSLLGRYRLIRVQRNVEQCLDCAKCNAECQFGLDPMRDQFGQECNNCCACMAVCPTNTLVLATQIVDAPYKGPGHLGNQYANCKTHAKG